MGKFNSQALRRIAKDVVAEIAQQEQISESTQRDFETSLVRQWITYKSHATLFLGSLGERQRHYVLDAAADGGYALTFGPVEPGWIDQLRDTWKINENELPGIIEQLNRGQSAEVVNTDGVRVRIWVNPQQQQQGAEPVDSSPPESKLKRDYHKIAAYELREWFQDVDDEAREELVCSVARQWQQHQGNACLFLNEAQQLVLVLTERSDGYCQVGTSTRRVNVAKVFSALGIPAEKVPEVIRCINLGQEVEFRDSEARPSRLRYDPITRRFAVERLQPLAMPPILCTKCSALLNFWRESDTQQTCRLCGQVISRS